jgi:hypothetical protein
MNSSYWFLGTKQIQSRAAQNSCKINTVGQAFFYNTDIFFYCTKPSDQFRSKPPPSSLAFAVCSKLSQQTTHHVKLGRVVDSLLLSRKSLSTATQFLTAQGYQIYKKSGYKLSFFGEPCKHSRRKGTKQ